MKGIESKRTRFPKGRRTRLAIAIVAAFALALSLFAFAGCSCSAQSSASASAASENASSAASAAASAAASNAASSATKVQVPNVVGLKQNDAEQHLKGAKLALGNVSYDYSDTVAQGLVISQKPEARANVDSGTKVDITISRGKNAPAQVTVPKLIGMSQTEAEQALSGAKLVAVVGEPIESTDVEAGLVCKQSVTAGTVVDEGSKVTIQTALAKQNVEVPDVVGRPADGAKSQIEKAGLGCDTSTVYSDTVAKDNVVSQSIEGGTSVVKGTVVVLQVSLGPKPVQKVPVPDILTYTLDDAIEALDSAGLSYRYGGDEDGTVVSVDPAVGTEVEVGSSVAFTLQKQVKVVTVPDVSGMAGEDAADELQDVGLVLDYDRDNPGKTVSGTNPAAGISVEEGTIVLAEYAPEPEPAPDDWTPASSADEAAQKAGVDFFDVMDSVMVESGTYTSPQFSYKKGMVQAVYEKAASEVVVRKGQGVSQSAVSEGLGSFPVSWTQNLKGLNITCHGDEKGDATLLEWSVGDMNYAASLVGLGGDTMTMDADEVSSLVVGIQ